MRVSLGGMKQLEKQKSHSQPAQLPESYLLCRECDGTWVDGRAGTCAHCPLDTASQDFHLCLSCALNEKRCQHCGQEMPVRISIC